MTNIQMIYMNFTAILIRSYCKRKMILFINDKLLLELNLIQSFSCFLKSLGTAVLWKFNNLLTPNRASAALSKTRSSLYTAFSWHLS